MSNVRLSPVASFAALAVIAMTLMTAVSAQPPYWRSLNDMRAHTYRYETTLTNDIARIHDESQRIAFVRSVAAMRVDALSAGTSWSNVALRKSAALSLLGETDGTNNCDVILAELAFSDPTLCSYPAEHALVKKGKVALPAIWAYVHSFDGKHGYNTLSSAGGALMEILGKREYLKQVHEVRGSVSVHVYQYLEAVYEMD
jgi:hypothetical protein